MMSCAVYGCTNNVATNSDPTVQYYYFPKHPLITQQWIAACWRADPIDINTARVCSIHFDNDSYTAEYKMLDYLGNYARMLKYDAVPTLYLPSLQNPVLMKTSTIDSAATLSTEPINDIKDIIVYEVQNITDPTNYLEIEQTQSLHSMESTDIKFNTETDSNQVIPSTNLEAYKLELDESTAEDDEKYKHISNMQQLGNLKRENISLRQTIEKMEAAVKSMEKQVTEKSQTLKTSEEELRKLLHQLDLVKRSHMSITEQKSVLGKVFSESQIKILSGKKKIYWSNDDMAIGYTIRHLSNKRCYMYLSKNLNIPLPALSSIKRWSTLKKNESKKETKKEIEDNKFEDEDST